MESRTGQGNPRPEDRSPDEEIPYRELFEKSNDAIFVESLSGEILDANPHACKMLGYSREALLRLQVKDLVPPALAKELPAVFKEVEEKGGMVMEAENRRKDGSVFPVEVSGSIVRFRGKKALLVLVRDITERKRAEEALRREKENEDLYRSLVETLPDGITLTDLEGKLVMANRQGARLYGCDTVEELLAYEKKALDLISKEDRERAARNARKVLEGGKVRNIEYRILRKDGTTYPGEISASLLLDADGKPKGFIGVVRDISERKRAQEEILEKSLELEKTMKRLEEIEAWMTESEKMRSLGTLAGGVAHEFNNIIGGIMGCASYLLLHVPDEGEVREYLDMIVNATKQASHLTRQLLGLMSKVKTEPSPFSLNETTNELSRMLVHTFPGNIEIRTELEADLPLAMGTPAQVYQALLNLCVNARDAMPSGGALTLKTGRVTDGVVNGLLPPPVKPGRFVFVTVEDEGEGIPSGIRDRIFEPFFTTKTCAEGTGLGLSLVKGIIKNHGGAIHVRSDAGRGSAFTLFFPLAAPREEPTPAAKIETIRGGSGRVLLVDDEKINRMVLEKILGRHGFEILTASSGEEAFEILRAEKGRVDLLILDLAMPGWGGEETFKKVRDAFPGVKIVILSGQADDKLTAEFIEAGACSFIYKPLNAREILNAVNAAMGPR